MVNYLDHDDFQLLEMMRESDELAFAELFNRYDRLLFLYAYRRLGDEEEAKDIVQDVFVNLWNNRNSFHLQSTLVGYLYTAVRHKALNLFRERNVQVKYLSSLQDLFDKSDLKSDYLIREKDISKLIEQEIAALPPKMREVFDLRHKAYLSNREIAERLGISEQTVATHIKRALKVLRLKLGILVYLFWITQ